MVVLGSACDGSPSGLDAEAYGLVTVNGNPLPGPYPDPALPSNTFEVVSGTLTLNPDGTLVQELVRRCASPPPEGTECHVEGDGKVAVEGEYSRTLGEVELGGTRFPATFEASRVTITIAYPPSQGFSPSFVLEYHR